MKVFEQPLFDWERPRVMVDTREHGRTVVVWEEGLCGADARHSIATRASE
jgi:hypothetical protein